MARRISALTTAATAEDDDVLPIVQGGTTKKVTVSTLLDGVTSSVADDIAKSAGSAIDRVQGFRGKSLDNVTPASGETWIMKNDATGYRKGKPVPPSWFDVVQYGALGDGTTDDTAAINLAIAAANSAGGGVVYFPIGNYRVNTSPLTTPSNGVVLRGCGSQHAAGAGSILHFYDNTESGIYLSEENNANSSRRSGIEGLTFRLRVDQTIANEAALQTSGIAAIEIRGGTKFHIWDCKLYDWPIGICLDGAEETEIYRCAISGVGGGYTAQTTLAYGIWLVDGSTRGKGFTFGGTTNQIQVYGGMIEGIWKNVFQEGGVGHVFEDVNMEGGGWAFFIGAPQLCFYKNLTCEGYSQAYIKVDASSAPSQLTFDTCFFGGSDVTLDLSASSASVDQLTMRNCRMGGPNGGSAIVSSNRILRHHFENVYCPQVGVALLDGECGGVGVGIASRDAVSTPKGLRVNSASPGEAVVHGSIVSAGDPLLKMDNADTLDSVQWKQPSYQELNMERRLKSTASSTVTSGDDDVTAHKKITAGAAASNVFSIAIPDDFCGLATWEVVGRGGTASNYGIWRRSRSFYRAGGAITFIAAAADDVAPVTSGIAPTAPNIADDGSNNLVLQLSSDASLDVTYVARLRILRAVE